MGEERLEGARTGTGAADGPGREGGQAAGLLRPEPRWPAELAVVTALVFYAVLPNPLIISPRWLIPVLEGLLIVPLGIRHRLGGSLREPVWRAVAVAVIALVNVANIVSVALLVHKVLRGTASSGTELLYAAVAIWVTNVIVFGLWYWELDRGGPTARGTGAERHPDFYFPQMMSKELAPTGWRPNFVDYLYLGFTDATAFSPTDAMPVTAAAKSLMTVEAMVSLVTVLVIASRAINIIA